MEKISADQYMSAVIEGLYQLQSAPLSQSLQISGVVDRAIAVLKNRKLIATNDRLFGQEQAHFLPVHDAVWKLVLQGVLAPGHEEGSMQFPFLHLTEFGEEVIKQRSINAFDPGGYRARLKEMVPNLEPAIMQYVGEGLECMQRRLPFAAAGMFGAAAECAALILLDSIRQAYMRNPARTNKVADLTRLIDMPKLPTIFNEIKEAIALVNIKHGPMPYQVHEGSSLHLLSLSEMIRATRNGAVHPQTGSVDENKLVLIVNGMPAALQSLYKLAGWFKGNTMP